jgi:hypothetical protein
MPRVALADSLQLCRTSGCLYTPFIQDQHLPIASSLTVSTATEDLFPRCVFQDFAGYPWILCIVDLRPLRGRHTYKASQTHAACFKCVGTTIRERLRRPLIFFVVQTCWETCFSSRHYSTFVFFSFFFGSSYRPSYLPRFSDTTL